MDLVYYSHTLRNYHCHLLEMNQISLRGSFQKVKDREWD